MRSFTIAFVVLVALVVQTSPASANSGCGTYSFGFTGTRLINDGISNSAGPFNIELPGGTYDVTVWFDDHHDQQPDPHQPNEQFHVRLNGGYTSPATPDLPDDANASTHTFHSQTISPASQISVFHRGVGGVNSINVECVGFTPSAPPVAVLPIVPVLPGQDIGDPAMIERPPPDMTPAPPPVEQVKPVVPVAEPEPVPEVLGAVEEPPPAVLALTGPNQTLLLINGAMLSIGVGLLLRRTVRRHPVRND
ncbi:MAG: hypothetical protein HKN94_13900 [Acidimicrobiales bacterium]|nr:hypothetical protein [Acidimicrobiales bacterium]RZV48557.1 MAG: hypothetical protein EX269_01415 [Acidimicrobiales bacterium]